MEKKGKFDYILLETTGLADPGSMRSAKSGGIYLEDLYLIYFSFSSSGLGMI